MASKVIYAIVVVSAFAYCRGAVNGISKMPPTCDSLVYCQGRLLHMVQMARLEDDSKTFVDKSMVNSVEVTLSKFDRLMNKTGNKPSKEQLKTFVDTNFVSENELEDWIPDDFVENPSFLSKITDQNVKAFAKTIVGIWKDLGRKVKDEVRTDPGRHSLIYVPNGFIIPGGRFREYYYWDSYWIIQGLLICEMYETVKGMLDNFLSLVHTYGHIPNGGRVYYLQRSQPPLLAHMAKLYYKQTNDINWVKANVDTLEKEVLFWVKNRMITVDVDGRTYKLAIYYARSQGPRPESYYEDYMTVNHLKSERQKNDMYIQLKSAAESGWDFSSRWFFDGEGGNDGNLTSIQTSRIAPVDLNAFLYGAFVILSDFYGDVLNEKKKAYWHKKARLLNQTIQKLLWNEEDGIWYDLDLQYLQPRRSFSASNLAPLWTQAYNTEKSNTEDLIKSVIEYLKDEEVTDYQGGIPSSLERTGEQWDLPNAWPCSQEIVIEGLAKSNVPLGRYWAKRLAKRWVHASMIGFREKGAMFEKYDAEYPGQYGGGGEYNVQTGFGWSNGVILELISKYYT